MIALVFCMLWAAACLWQVVDSTRRFSEAMRGHEAQKALQPRDADHSWVETEAMWRNRRHGEMLFVNVKSEARVKPHSLSCCCMHCSEPSNLTRAQWEALRGSCEKQRALSRRASRDSA